MRIAIEAAPVMSLETYLARLSMEEGFLSNLIDTFSKMIPSAISKISDFIPTIERSNDISEDVQRISKFAKGVSEKTKVVSFSTFEKTLVTVPESFKGNLIEFLKMLDSELPKMYADINKLLGEYTYILSAFLTQKNNQISLKDHDALFAASEKARVALEKKVSYFFTGQHNSSKQRLGQVIGRFSDLNELEQLVRSIDNQRHKKNLEQIASSVKTAVQYLSMIREQANKGGIDTVSPAAAKNIAEGALEVAKFVETITIVRYRTEQAVACVLQLFEQIDSMVS